MPRSHLPVSTHTSAPCMLALWLSALSSSTDITPTIARGPESQSVSEGESVHFLCLHSDSLPAADLYWTHDSQEVSPGDSPRLRVSTSVLSPMQVSSTLSISAVELVDAGQYVCVAINPLLPSSAVESAPATLTVRGRRGAGGGYRAPCSLHLPTPPPPQLCRRRPPSQLTPVLSSSRSLEGQQPLPAPSLAIPRRPLSGCTMGSLSELACVWLSLWWGWSRS